MQRYIDVIAAHMDGKKIEYRHADPEDEDEGGWRMPAFLTWNFAKYEYRVAPEPKIPDTIEWDHVAPEFKFMARDRNGVGYVFKHCPIISSAVWDDYELGAMCSGFASYKRGNMDWQDSLVARPQP